jgi:hypothetical protein
VGRVLLLVCAASLRCEGNMRAEEWMGKSLERVLFWSVRAEKCNTFEERTGCLPMRGNASGGRSTASAQKAGEEGMVCGRKLGGGRERWRGSRVCVGSGFLASGFWQRSYTPPQGGRALPRGGRRKKAHRSSTLARAATRAVKRGSGAILTRARLSDMQTRGARKFSPRAPRSLHIIESRVQE